MKKILSLIVLIATLAISNLTAEDVKLTPSLLSGLKARSIGPALVSGRISDIAVNPENTSEWYVAVSAGHVWKTTNAGHSFTPIFDNQNSFSIGCVTLDPSNPHIVWVGTGENNSQRSVDWGDGVYKSKDGGKTWENMGLKKSEHIGKILVDPRNSNVVYVAAQGPLWNAGDDRGLYKTIDGGKTWKKVLEISDDTGVSDIAFDPRNPDVVYATSYQRRRHTWTLINGGPESAIYKTENGGHTWDKVMNGMPKGDIGRIGIAVSPVNPDKVFAIVEAEGSTGGFFLSTDRGASWTKMNSYVSASPQYYQELVCDPVNENKVYSLSTYTMVTENNGKTFYKLSNNKRHVDDHALYIDPKNTEHLVIGGDGGIYETYDNAKTWRYCSNFPITQFYRIQADNSKPFYWVYGGTQDNNTIGGPSRSINNGGVFNMDWIYVVGGDGYEPQIDPENPNIVYGQWQYGNVVRLDKKSGEKIGIKPDGDLDEEIRWNWDTPLLLSNFDNKRLYIAANKVFRTDDRGDTWKKISPDLTRQTKRNELEIMGKIQTPEAVAKNQSTSVYGNIISLTESPKNENILYVGTDDGLIQVTKNGGETWTKIEKFTGVPEETYVSDVFASRHNESVVYATFNNHKRGDYKPYILKSTNNGGSWESIANDFPDNNPIWTIEEDTHNPDLLFVGTEFGLYYTINGGNKWMKFEAGLPKALPVRDLDIQERENDLVIGTFGRGIYIIDDYTPLRKLAQDEAILMNNAYIFPIKDALMYHQSSTKIRHNEGETFYIAPNPEFGAIFTYYVKENIKSLKTLRKEEWKASVKDGEKPQYPTFAELRAEDLQSTPYLIFTISNIDGEVIRKLKAPYSKGINRIAWDFRYASEEAYSAKSKINRAAGMPVMPGAYKVYMSKFEDGKITKLTEPVEFLCMPLGNLSMPNTNTKELDAYRKNITKLQAKINATDKVVSNLQKNIDIIITTLLANTYTDNSTLEKAYTIKSKLFDINEMINGDVSISKRAGAQPVAIAERVGYAVWLSWSCSSNPTNTYKTVYETSNEKINEILTQLQTIKDIEIDAINKELDKYGAPWTPGRFPQK